MHENILRNKKNEIILYMKKYNSNCNQSLDYKDDSLILIWQFFIQLFLLGSDGSYHTLMNWYNMSYHIIYNEEQRSWNTFYIFLHTSYIIPCFYVGKKISYQVYTEIR